MARMKTRLLTAPSMSTRAALLDNVKSFNFSWPELEALITSPTINGHRMYQGDASRPNNLCWFITFNGASLSKDMAQRSVIIKLRRTECTQTWESDVKQYIADHAPSIVAAVVARLREPAEPLRRYTRWSGWESAVLSRLPEPADAQRVIAERQGEADVDEDKSELIFDGFAERLADLNYNIETDRVHIPASVAHEWLNEILGEKESVTKTTRYLKQLVTENRTSMIQIDPSRTTGRGFLWAGPNEPARTDIKARIDMKKQRQSGRMF